MRPDRAAAASPCRGVARDAGRADGHAQGGRRRRRPTSACWPCARPGCGCGRPTARAVREDPGRGRALRLPQTEEPPTLRAGNSGAVYFAVNGETYGPAGTRRPGDQEPRAVGRRARRRRYPVADLRRTPTSRRSIAVAEAAADAAHRSDRSAAARPRHRGACARCRAAVAPLRTAAAWAIGAREQLERRVAMSLNPVRPWRNIYRRKSRQIMVGNVPVGGDAPISVQTMTNTDTSDVRGDGGAGAARGRGRRRHRARLDPGRGLDPRAAARSCAKARCRSSPTSISTTSARSRRPRRARPACGSTPATSATRSA